ncbi:MULTISPECIES: phosphate ABC transporter permease subunit PstC [unclassified Thalassolituus]|jgi:phosphate transport system permease protein|uniref:phosphate ABC transporter permease subunit PstC n=1 Tax=Oceanospirillaceae TaxID=135620 RepID=UPI000C3EB6CA|nr:MULTISPECIES: phosphate ABC transporter permease subunit PstC [unclassified Thalassolituus]MAY13717.1 phosphate ABC transporter permease subunit PstC [Oceanospirillaceae bacterium]MCA6058920.1 phosphate ABC transporter permease subunit PstC [Thalassolituus sp. ST750PaO-4]PIQ39937.1 MAG: phosphate ABC transporter permease subunit PstC [Thalassolituus sp. CG17_big_fil_post_rev_8_21_14_2_50_53_8]TVV44719.1 phosphate ABC transporter permease subunit PstC [Thalassolituus sp. C2-1]
MNYSSLIIAVLILLGGAYLLGRNRARAIASQGMRLHSLPTHYGALMALWTGLPPLLLLLIWGLAEAPVIDHLLIAQLPEAIQQGSSSDIQLAISKVHNLAIGSGISAAPELEPAVRHLIDLQERTLILHSGMVLSLALLGIALTWRRIKADMRARTEVESIVRRLLFASSGVAVLTTLGILASVLYEAWQFFGKVSPFEFLFGTTWSPQVALRADQSGSSGSFGAVPLFAGTLLISLIAMFIAVPVGLMAAIYLSEYATPTIRQYAKPALEILAGIPTVVYGFFAALTVAPVIRELGESMGLTVSSESALAAGLVMGIMIIPFVSSLSDDVINAVPQSLRDGSYGLGATKSETVKEVVIPAALPGIVGAIMLAVSRAIGETMIVAMAAGLAANLTANPLDSVTTVTVQIVTLLVGDQEFDSPKTLAAFALGLVLFLVTLALNFVALKVVQKYREQYD